MDVVDWVAYKEGFHSCEVVSNDTTKAENPYKKLSLKWYSWNRGWNAYDPNN